MLLLIRSQQTVAVWNNGGVEGKIYDITHRLVEGMPAYGSAKGTGPIVNETRGNETYYGTIKLNTHMGTHVDSPGHLFQDLYEAGFDVDSLNLRTLNGNISIVIIIYIYIYICICCFWIWIGSVNRVFNCIDSFFLYESEKLIWVLTGPVLVIDTPRDKNITGINFLVTFII